MRQIKNYFKSWDVSRILKMFLSVALLISYFYNKENFFLFIGLMLGIQAIFNISCPGGSCNTTTNKNTKPIVETEKYEPKN